MKAYVLWYGVRKDYRDFKYDYPEFIAAFFSEEEAKEKAFEANKSWIANFVKSEKESHDKGIEIWDKAQYLFEGGFRDSPPKGSRPEPFDESDLDVEGTLEWINHYYYEEIEVV